MRWRALAQGQTFSPHVWGDTYLAGFALAGNLELVSFDQGFAQYQGLRRTLLP
jgi:predicted nucleic acid-binding protein